MPRHMPVAVDFEMILREAEKALRAAQTAGDGLLRKARAAWRKYLPSPGHRTLGGLLQGREAAEILAKRDRERDKD
ncbi:MAG: hypothetical protein WEC75_08455 [Dehalococcoidia bacterium]